MRRHGWTIPVIFELYTPDVSPDLLGYNNVRLSEDMPPPRTHQSPRIFQSPGIWLRLRESSKAELFLDERTILDTLIHELAHMEVFGHGEAFQKLYQTLVDEFSEICHRTNG